MTTRPFFISDTHFDHHRIIEHCHRPFDSVEEMNETLVANWNGTVNPQDTVCHLGDICRYNNPFEWLDRLNGNKIIIRGGHDRAIPRRAARPYDIISVDGLDFYLVHDPLYVPPDWDGWVIHGHIHNNDLVHYPFFNRAKRRVNVSVELIGYRPISLAEILQLVKTADYASISEIGRVYSHNKPR